MGMLNTQHHTAHLAITLVILALFSRLLALPAMRATPYMALSVYQFVSHPARLVPIIEIIALRAFGDIILVAVNAFNVVLDIITTLLRNLVKFF